MAADAGGERQGLSCGPAVFSYRALYREASEAAAWIGSQAQIERVAYLGLNGPQQAIALFASAMAERAFIPLNYRLPDANLRALVERCAPALIVADDDFASRAGHSPGNRV